MPTIEVAKAWKDEDYRDTLTTEQQAQLPQNPAGVIEFGEPQLEDESLFGPAAKKSCKFISNYTAKNTQCTTSNPGHCK
jgi:mersacidin/lichenicidin family type 2 lantibiotic